MNILKYFILSIIFLIVAVAAFFTFGGPLWQAHVRASYDRDIQKFTRAVETAADDDARAEAYSSRGSVYSEKARYGRMFKLISFDEYLRLFDAAVADHAKAIAINPNYSKYVFARGMTHYNRAVAIDQLDFHKDEYFRPAAADFARAAELDPDDLSAWDMLGLTEEGAARYEQAIAAFTHVLKLDAGRGNGRLAETYCQKAYARVKGGMIPAAILDYEKSLEFRSPADPCECDAYNALAGIYVERGELGLAKKVIAKAAADRHAIAPETLKALAEKTIVP